MSLASERVSTAADHITKIIASLEKNTANVDIRTGTHSREEVVILSINFYDEIHTELKGAEYEIERADVAGLESRIDELESQVAELEKAAEEKNA